MVAQAGGRLNKHREKEEARQRENSSDDDDEDDEQQECRNRPPLKFVLAGDDTGGGIEYSVLDQERWEKLEAYCKKWGIKQAHLESIYARFSRTIARTEHLDFTRKPQHHASLDFLADEFMTTAGEFAAQIFIQTWFLRRKGGLKPPKDRRSVDFARLVIMCSDLARLGDYELLANLWACVLHRFGGILPNGALDLDTQLNTELVEEVITLLHTIPDKKLNLLIAMVLDESKELEAESTGGARGTGSGSKERERDEGDPHGDNDDNDTNSNEEAGGGAPIQARPRRYLTLRSILRFSFQHPPLMFPVVQFQRLLRSKILGSRYWLRRRTPASERGVDMRSLLGLPNAYRDVFDRIESLGDAWVVASGHLLLHALDPPPRGAADAAASFANTSTGACGRRTRREEGADGAGHDDGTEKEQYDERYEERCEERYRRLLENCLQPPWYRDGDKPASNTVAKGAGSKIFPMLAATLTRFKARTSSPPNSPRRAKSGKNREEDRDTPNLVVRPEPSSPRNAHTSSPSPSPKRGRPGRSRNHSRSGPRHSECSDDTGTPACTPATAIAAIAGGSGAKICAICLRKKSAAAMCPKCGRRAAQALKDKQGSRQARVILVSYGAHFGVGEADALEKEGHSIERWVRLLDDETGGDFYYNIHYDSSVWKAGIKLPKPAPTIKIARRRKGGGGGGLVTTGSPDRASPSIRKTTPATAPGVPPADAVPEVILDAHKRIYPPSRLISSHLWEDAKTTAAVTTAAKVGGTKGVSPVSGHGFARKDSSRGTAGESAGRGRRRLSTKAGTRGEGVGVVSRAGTMTAASVATAAAAASTL